MQYVSTPQIKKKNKCKSLWGMRLSERRASKSTFGLYLETDLTYCHLSQEVLSSMLDDKSLVQDPTEVFQLVEIIGSGIIKQPEKYPLILL
jgi:hypothetical protein